MYSCLLVFRAVEVKMKKGYCNWAEKDNGITCIYVIDTLFINTDEEKSFDSPR